MNDMINGHTRNDRRSDKRACNILFYNWLVETLNPACLRHNFHGFGQKSCTLVLSDRPQSAPITTSVREILGHNQSEPSVSKSNQLLIGELSVFLC